jgi:hypothetical protein
MTPVIPLLVWLLTAYLVWRSFRRHRAYSSVNGSWWRLWLVAPGLFLMVLVALWLSRLRF